MYESVQTFVAPRRKNVSTMVSMGILLGVAMPLLSAIAYPTYANSMRGGFAEWTRLGEMPFLLCELALIIGAVFRGMEIRKVFPCLPNDIKFAIAIGLIGICYSSIFVSKVPLTSIAISFGYCLHGLFAISILYFFKTEFSDKSERLAFWLCAGLVPLALLTAWRFLTPPPAATVLGGYLDWSAALPGFISVRHFGSWTGALMVLSAAMALQASGTRTGRVWYALYFLSSFLTIWSGTRAAILAFGLAMAFFCVSQRKFPSVKVFGHFSVLTGSGAILALLLQPYGDDRFWLFHIGEIDNAANFTAGRTLLWKLTYLKWLEAPWFGWGSGSNFWEVSTGGRNTHPHNALLQFLINWGFVGAIGVLWIIIRALRKAYCIVSAQPELWPFFASLLSLVIMSMLEGMLYYPRFIILMIVYYMIIFARERRKTLPSYRRVTPPPSPPARSGPCR